MSHLHFRRYIKKAEGTAATAVEVTQDNVVQIRTLWKQPTAEVGQFYVRFGVGGSKMMDAKRFSKLYRDPA